MRYKSRHASSSHFGRRGGFFLTATVVLALSAIGAGLFAAHQTSDAASAVLVPSSDRANDATGWQDDGNSIDCGTSGTQCSEEIDEDIDNENDDENDRIETESSDPTNDRVEFELSDPPGAGVTEITVRYSAREVNEGGADNGQIMLEVMNGATALGSPSLHDLTTSFDDYSYTVTGLGLTAAEADALYLRITGNGNRQIELSVVNVEVDYTIAPNPELAQSCGVDMVIVIDRSSSIDAGELADIKAAMTDFVDAFLPGTPTQIAVVQFSTQAQVIQAFSDDASTVNAAINGITVPGSTEYTNWDEALFDARNLFPNRADKPDLIVFGSDGNPNTIIGGAGGAAGRATAVAEAVDQAELAKADGIRIQAIGIGDNLDVANLEAISEEGGVIESDFDQLAGDLADLAAELCGGTITVHKVIDADGNTGTTNDQTDGAGWTFSANAGADSSDPASGDTDQDGLINFDIDLGGDDQATVDIAETLEAGHTFISASCENDQGSVGTPGNLEVTGITVGPLDIIICTFYNQPAIQFEVRKDFEPTVGDSVMVSLSCTGATVTPAGQQAASEGSPAVFTVSGFVGDPNCTGTESPVPDGYSSLGSCAAALSAGYCTITNNQNTITYEVSKGWSPANPGGQVDIRLDCGPGVTISPAATQQITGDGSAFFTVTGWDGSPPSCTATEDPNPPSGYTASNGGQCNVSAQVISCTITNTQNSDTFEVTKDWVPDNANGIVDVTLDCGPGVNIGPANPQTITGDSSVSFTVTGFVGDPLCTATEAPNPPSGYASAGTCSEDLSAGGCTITNDQNTITYEVSKVWSPANPGGQVNITLDCGPGLTISPSATQGITGDGSAFFTVTGWDTPPSCTATEDPNPPSGYTASNGGQCNVDENTTACTITNTLNTDTFEVTKDWDPDNSAGVINVTLDCGPGVTIGPANPQQITGDSSVVFTVSGFQGDPLCTATEDPNPPAGYTALDGGQCSDNLSDEGCTITNKLNSAKFIVRKLFSPSSDAGVNVAIECGGNGDISPPAATATEAAPAEFTITGFTPPLVCSAMETPVPNGYMASDDCQGVAIALDGEAECTITNTLRTATFEVHKDFEPTIGDSVMVSVSCSSGAVSPDNAQAVAEGSPAAWTVTGFHSGATCTASESVPAGYTADQSDCSQGKALVVNDTVSCTIVNTLNEADFIVYKDFEPTVADTVSVTVECTSGTVVTGAQDVAEGDPKTFHVVGFTANPEPTCTATEAQAPAGYISSGECSDGLFDPGSCTITNTLRTDDFQVIKDFDPDSDAPVTVELNCTSGTPDPASAQASEGSPAAFTVNGFTPGAVCTGMETQIPGGYSSTGQCSATIEEGSCVIYNTLNRATFTVNKDFLDDNAGQVMVTVTCTSGNVDPDGHQAVSENSPGVWEITGFTPPFSCTATEAVPDGYTPDQSGCQAVTYPDQGEFGCTITNEPVRRPFTVKKDFQPDSGASVFVELVCSGANISPSNGQPASEASPAVFEVIGGTDSMLCSGFEVPIPGGYTSTGVCMAVITAGECTIVNTLVTPSPTPTPPSATPTPSPSPTVVGEQPTPTPSPTPTSEPPTMTPTPPVTDAPTPEPTNEPTDEPTPTPTPTSSPTATPTATPTSTPTALPVTSVPATPSAGPVQFPPTGGTPGMGGSMMVWIVIAGLSCLVTGATFAALALRRR